MDLNRKRMNAGITAEDNRSELSAGSTVTLEITAYGSEGQGIARHNGMAVFVPGAICGETVEAEIKKAAPSFAEAKLQKILRPSAERVIPPCPHYAECGGCDILHMSYAEQLRMKRETVRSAMERIGGFRGIEILPCIGADKPEHYRNKAVFQFANAEKTNKKNLRQVLSGYYEQKSHKLVPVETCMIQNEEAMTAKRIVAEWANLFDIRAFDEKQKSGTLRQLMVRRTEGGTMAAIVTTGALPHSDELVSMLRRGLPSLASCIHGINRNPRDPGIGSKTELLFGSAELAETVCGLKFNVGAHSFLQVNPEQTQKLYLAAANALNLTANDDVADVFCGIGTISLLLAQRARSVLGIEAVPPAVKDARRNAKLNNIKNAEFICENAETALPRLVAEGKRFSAILLDPPRRGAEKPALDAIVNSGAERIAYVSCNPATLARDCKILAAAGYSPMSVQPVDMFPMTHHVESVCLLSKLQAKQHIEIDLNMDELDLTDAEKKATYQEIKDYVLEHSGLKVSSLYIAQIKQKCGIIERENYNKPKSEDAKQPQCPLDKEKAIKEALQHFGMI